MSEEDILSLGFNSKENTYYSISRGESYNNLFTELTISFQMTESLVSHSRSVYSFWDFLGDVGGLNDIMRLLGTWIVTFV